ncbi:hypothetical protein CYMTET_9655 [Cymbomonas tetramitiformis]|uniref:Uncharacterized protein n=1 Tax=Cymbomonas tetramitiformis TaxID=36881 RepID=A0AAE0GQK4_9CHLO|nr:hypothetical protein CYMTET_9655 [Cymbomonas tetramitiformis]
MRGFFGGRWFSVKWDEVRQWKVLPFSPFRDEASSHINYLWLFLIFWALNLWGHLLKGCKIVLWSDNESARLMTGKATFIPLLKEILLLTVKHDLRIVTKKISSKANGLADALSRSEMGKFFELLKEWSRRDSPRDLDDWMRVAPRTTSAVFVLPFWPTERFWLEIVVPAIDCGLFQLVEFVPEGSEVPGSTPEREGLAENWQKGSIRGTLRLYLAALLHVKQGIRGDGKEHPETVRLYLAALAAEGEHPRRRRGASEETVRLYLAALLHIKRGIEETVRLYLARLQHPGDSTWRRFPQNGSIERRAPLY